MEENRDYHAYRYGDHLTPGSELKIEHSVVCENVDISTLITMGIDSLEAMRQGSIDGEQKAYEIVVAAAKQWEQQAAATQTINRALEYLRTPEIEHTGNQWKDTDNWRADQKISNRVYQMTCSIWEDTKYDRETKQSVPIAWYVTWEVRIHSPKQGYGAKIAGQNQKRYEHFGTMVCFHPRYALGDHHNYMDKDDFLREMYLDTVGHDEAGMKRYERMVNIVSSRFRHGPKTEERAIDEAIP